MSHRPQYLGRALLVVPATLVALVAAAPAATAKTTLKLTVPAQADAGARVPFTYATKGLPRHGRLVVQRVQGTARRWKAVKTVKRGRGGKATLPALDWGRYEYRLAVVRGGRTTARSRRVRTAVFKTVTLGALFGRTPATVTTPSRTFPYVLTANSYAGREGVVTVDTSNPCRAIHVDWTTSSDFTVTADVQYSMTLLRQSADPVGSQAPFQGISGFDAALTPGETWSLRFGFGENGVGSVDANVDGTANCSGPIELE